MVLRADRRGVAFGVARSGGLSTPRIVLGLGFGKTRRPGPNAWLAVSVLEDQESQLAVFDIGRTADVFDHRCADTPLCAGASRLSALNNSKKVFGVDNR